METFQSILIRLRAVMDTPLLPIGTKPFTLWVLLYLAILLFLLIYLTGKLKVWVVDRVLQ